MFRISEGTLEKSDDSRRVATGLSLDRMAMMKVLCSQIIARDEQVWLCRISRSTNRFHGKQAGVGVKPANNPRFGQKVSRGTHCLDVAA